MLTNCQEKTEPKPRFLWEKPTETDRSCMCLFVHLWTPANRGCKRKLCLIFVIFVWVSETRSGDSSTLLLSIASLITSNSCKNNFPCLAYALLILYLVYQTHIWYYFCKFQLKFIIVSSLACIAVMSPSESFADIKGDRFRFHLQHTGPILTFSRFFRWIQN